MRQRASSAHVTKEKQSMSTKKALPAQLASTLKGNGKTLPPTPPPKANPHKPSVGGG